MKISILSYDLSHNCLGRAYLLAKILLKRYKVEIIGPILGEGIWNPVKDDKSIKYKIINKKFNIKEILSLIDGDIVYAIKPKGTSFGYGLFKKLRSKKPLILDIDDWELGFFLSNPFYFCFSLAHFWDLNNAFYTFLLERFTRYADAITASSSFLQKKFGGIIIPHVRNTYLLNPNKYNQINIRKKLSIKDKKIIMFFGTIGKHKGIDDLIYAVEKLNRENVILMLVGVNFNDPYVKELIKKNNEKIKFIGQQPFEKVPEFLSIADIVVIPQKYSKSSVGQIPAKIFDAMAMAKPIISTKVSDIPKILKGCGIIVEPEDYNALSRKINYLLDNPKIAESLGKKARERCIKEYSFKAIEPKLFKIFEKYKKEIKNEL